MVAAETKVLLEKNDEPNVKPSWWIWLIVLCTAGATISYVDRTNIGIAIIPMAKEFHWSSSQQGLVLGAFFLGYTLTQILGGWLADSAHLSGFGVLALGEALWSLFTVLTPGSAKLGLSWLITMRVLLGAGEGIGYPAIHSLLGKLVPRKFMNGALASTAGGCYLGGMIALLASSPIAAHENLGWEYVFWLFGSIGGLWLIPWSILWWTAPKSPSPNSSHKNCWKVFFTTKRVYVLIFTNFCNAWGFWVFMSWMPTFYKAKFGTELKDLGYFSIIPYIVQAVVSFLAGFLGDWILHKQLISLRSLRIISQTIAMWGSGLFLMLSAVAAPNIYIGTMHSTISLGMLSLACLGANVGHLDLAPNHAGSLFGLINTASVFSGVIGVPLSGAVLDCSGNNWAAVFALTTLVYLVGSLVWIFMADPTPLDFGTETLATEGEK